MSDKQIPTWEESTPVETVPDAVPTWEESTPVENRVFSPTKKNWNALKTSFSGDPLAFIDDPQIKTDMEFTLAASKDAEVEKKKWALAAYFAQMRREDIQFCHGNLDALIEKFNGGKPQSVDAAYAAIGNILNGGRSGGNGFWESRPVSAMVAGEGEVAKGTFNVLGFLAKLWAGGTAAQIQADLLARNPDAAKLIRNPDEAAAMAEGAVRGVYKRHYEPIRVWGEENMRLPNDWMTNSDGIGDWCGNAAISFVNYMPQLAAQTGLMVATGGVSSLAMVYGINGYYEIKDDHPEMSEAQAFVYGTSIGLVNGGLEKITMGIINGQVSRDVAKAGIKKGLLSAAKHFGWNGTKEGLEEMTEQVAENLLDISMGLRGDRKEWKTSDYWREMRRGVPEAGFLGFTTGAPLSADSYVAYRKVAERQEAMRGAVHEKVQELSQKEDLSPEESSELEKLKIIDDAGDVRDVAATARELYEREIIRQREEAQADAELSDEERVKKEANAARENHRMRQNLPFNPQETMDVATDLVRQFPNVKLEILHDPSELPADVAAKIDADGLSTEHVRAWVDDAGSVYLIASNVRPSEVARVLGHEIIGHKGLRSVFGGEFDSLLDQVYKDHFEDVLKLSTTYNRDTETVENQRYLTEEFLANCADASVKPSWWKEFLGFVRQQLRKILPKMHFSDADIESALSRSARAMRKRGAEAGYSGMDVRFSVVTDPQLLERLENEETITTYRAAQLHDGKLYPPMAAKIGGEWVQEIKLGQWEQADEHPERVKKDGKGKSKFKLDKGNGSSIEAAYNPYIHSSPTPLNDQFATAYKRPELVTLEIRVPKSELTSGYHANMAKDSVGMMEWKAGVVQGKISGKRQVMLSRWDKPIRIVPDSEVAQKIAEMMTGEDITIPANVVTPNLRRELEKVGVPVVDKDSIRFSIIGEEGAARTENAVTVLENLATARKMLESGKDMKTVKLATGWEKGGDGKWRTETPDGKIKDDGIGRLVSGHTIFLEDLYDAPELFSAYPQLRKMRVEPVSIGNFGGKYDPRWKSFTINTRTAFPRKADAGRWRYGADYIMYHEIQHAIQDIEGFAPGGNEQTGARLLQSGLYSSSKLSDAFRDFHANIRLLKGDVYTDIGRVLNDDAFFNFREVIDEDLGDFYGSKFTELLKNMYRTMEKDQFLKNYDSIREEAKKGHPDAHLLYRRLAGEIEARNVVKRMDMPLEERLKTLLAETEDVAEEDKIYLQQAGDIRFSVAPENENLIAVHNVSARKLRNAAKLGGMPVPSLAIVDSEVSDFSNFGEITLIADKELIDPKMRGNKVYNADIYSPRAPSITKKYSNADFDRVLAVLQKYDDTEKDAYDNVTKIVKGFKEGIYDSDFEDKLHGLPAVRKWYEQTEDADVDFESWWNNVALKELDFHPDEKIFNGYTPSGNRKWIPATLENVVKLMTKKVRNGEGFNYGIGNIRSMKAVQFKSIAQIQKARGNIVSAESLKRVKEDIQSELDELTARMKGENRGGKFGWEYNTGEDCIMAMAEGGYENIKYLHDRFGDNPELFREMENFLNKLRDLPTEYFEAKLQRVVGFDEFKAAVIPDDTPADVREILADAGIAIYTYGERQSRKAAVSMATMDNNLRFSLAEYSEADQHDIVAMLKPYAGLYADRNPEDYAKYLAGEGANIPKKDAWVFALQACRENIADARKRAEKRRADWIYENNPMWRECVDFCGGVEFKIKPASRFAGEDFSGTWISSEFVKYSEKRQQGKKESDASYRKYLNRREAALKKADGMASDELAEAIARKQGRDALDVEQELIDYFRNLKKPDLYKEYSAWKADNLAGDKEAQQRAFDEWMKSEQARIEEDVVQLLQNGKPITSEWIDENHDVYKELYRQMFHKDAPYLPGKKDLEAINAALIQEGANASTYAEAYKAARKKAYGEFMDKLREFRERVMNSKADAVRLQRDALEFAEKNLPQDARGAFARSIVGLLEYPTSPSGKYPEGRRMSEFRNLFDRMTRRAGEIRKTSGVEEIKSMLDAVKIKRNYKGIPTSVLPSEQAHVDRIRKIVDMNLPALANLITYNSEQIALLEDDPEKQNIRDGFIEDNALLEMFGNLDEKTADDVGVAAKALKDLIEGGKLKYREKLLQRKAEVEEMRKRAVNDATFGKNAYKDRGDAAKHSGYWLKNESLGTLMRIVSGDSIQNFDQSVHGELYRGVEDATQREQTALRRMQRDLDDALGVIAGVSAKNPVARMRQKGKFYRMVSEVTEHSGVFKTEYSRPIKTGKSDFVFEEGRRGLEKRSIPVEDYEWNGKKQRGARSILRDIDNGDTKVRYWDSIILDDTAVAFLRQQLADFDAGLKQSYEIFNDESDDANFNRMLEDERSAGRLVVFSHLPDEVSQTVEVPLSQGAALQILLTWEQEHYQPNMKWNGWTDESIRKLRKFIRPEVLKMGYWMRDYIAQNKAALDDKVFDRYGARLPLNEKYFPAAFRGGKTKNVRVDGELGRGAGSMSINPNFLIARKFHLKPVDTDADAFSSFLGNQLEQEHFLAWSDSIRDLKGVYGSTMVQKAVADNFGRAVIDNLVERVATIAQGGGKFNGEYATRLLGKFYRYWVPAKIALNPSSAIKQMFGVAAYMNHVPVRDFIRNMARANFSNTEFRDFVRWAKDTDYMKNRLAGGLDKDLQYLLNYTRDSKAYSPLSDALLQLGTWQTRWSDKWSTLHGGFACYKYALDQAKASGLTDADAIKAARRAWMRGTDETQQSGYLKDQNYFQANQGAYRYLTAFLTNPIQVMNLQLQTIHEIRYGKDKAAARKKLARQVLVNHLVVPTLMQFASDMIRYGFDVPEWWDNVEFEDYLLAWGLGSFEGAFLYGKMIQGIYDAFFKSKGGLAAGISAVPLLDDLVRDAKSARRIFGGDDELTEKDLMDAVKAVGDFGMLFGVVDSRAGAVGGFLHAIGAQGKKLIRWFDEE